MLEIKFCLIMRWSRRNFLNIGVKRAYEMFKDKLVFSHMMLWSNFKNIDVFRYVIIKIDICKKNRKIYFVRLIFIFLFIIFLLIFILISGMFFNEKK